MLSNFPLTAIPISKVEAEKAALLINVLYYYLALLWQFQHLHAKLTSLVVMTGLIRNLEEHFHRRPSCTVCNGESVMASELA